MRLHITLSPNQQPVYFDYPHFLSGALHAWLGRNELHDDLSLYSLGWLQGGKMRGSALHFPNGALWSISAPDTPAGMRLLESIANAALQKPRVCCGMDVVEIAAQKTPDFGTRRLFRADSPILVRGEVNQHGQVEHLRYDDPRADELLTKTLRHKLDKAGLPDAGATMCFDRSYKGAKTKLIAFKGIQNRANFCPVTVEGMPETVAFAWNVGAGHLTGCCFGCLA